MKKTKYAKTNDKSKKYILLRLWKYLYRYKLILLLSLILVIVSNVLALWGPNLSGKAIDAIGTTAGGVDFDAVLHYATLMIIFYVTSEVLSYVLSVLMMHLSKKVVFQMRKNIFDRLATLPVSFFDKHQTGEIISVISYDIDTINSSLSSDFLQVCKSVITIVGSFIMMLQIATTLLLVFVVTIPLSIIFTKYITTRRI